MGIKFGSSIDTVITVVKSKGGTLDISKPNQLNASGVKFAGRPTKNISFQFFDNKLYQIFITFNAERPPLTMDLYNNILTDLTSVYGKSVGIRKFNYPFQDDEKRVELALRGGYATISNAWLIRDNTINLNVDSSLTIGILYIDGKLSDLVNKGKKPIDDY